MSSLPNKPTKSNPPFYFYKGKGWKIDTKIKVDGQWKKLSKGYYSSLNEARADFSNQAQALAKRTQVCEPKPVALTWYEFRDRYMDYRRTKVRGSSLSTEKYLFRSVFDPIFDGLTAWQVFKRETAVKVQRAVTTTYKANRINKNKALRRYLDMLDYAYKHELLEEDADNRRCQAEISMITSTEEEEQVKERQVLTSEQCQTLLSFIKDPADKALTATMMFTGLRVGEALALRVQDFDFNSKEVSISRTIAYDEFGQLREYNRTKTALGRRTIPLFSEFCEFIVGYLSMRKLRGADLVFPSYEDSQRAMDGSAYRRRLTRYCKQASVPEISPHCLRHTFATLLSERCVTDADRQARAYVMGHSVTVDEKTYTAHNQFETAKRLIG